MIVELSVIDTTTGALLGTPYVIMSQVGPAGPAGALDADTPVDRIRFTDRTTGEVHSIFFDQGQMGRES